MSAYRPGEPRYRYTRHEHAVRQPFRTAFKLAIGWAVADGIAGLIRLAFAAALLAAIAYAAESYFR